MSGDEVKRSVAKALATFFGPAATEIGQMMADQVRLYRWKSAVRIFQRAEQFARKSGVPKANIPLKFLVPFVEKASLEGEDSDIIDNWAYLLLTAKI